MKKRRLIVVIAAVALLVFPSICANSTSPAMNECSWQSGRVCETDSIQLKGLERKLDSLTDLMRYTRQELRSVRRAYLSITYLKAVPMDSLYVRDSVLLASQKAEVQRLFAASELKLVERIQEQNAQIDKLKCYNVIATVLPDFEKTASQQVSGGFVGGCAAALGGSFGSGIFRIVSQIRRTHCKAGSDGIVSAGCGGL